MTNDEKTGDRKALLTGKLVTLIGAKVEAGQRAPEFRLIDNEMREVSLSDGKGKVRFIATYPSLSTGQCKYVATSIGDESISRLKTLYYVISAEPPAIQARYCRDDQAAGVTALSDYGDQSFGRSYGVLVSESKVLAPAVFVIDADDIVRFAEYFESPPLPRYKGALAAMQDALDECSRD